MDIHVSDKRRCITALILCLLVSSLVFYNLSYVFTFEGNSLYLGTDNLRYFTYESNVFVGIVSFLCVPFQIEGLRNRNYHLPRWLVNVLYVAVCTVTVTLILTMAVIVPTFGYEFAYITKGGFIPHLIVPIISMITFIFINDDHEIHRKVYLLALIPVVLYAVVYIFNVFVIDIWEDHYNVGSLGPVWLIFIGLIIVYFLIAIMLRRLHNRRHYKREKQVKAYYTYGKEVSYDTIDEAIINLAKKDKEYDRGGDVIVPRRVIIMMEEKYNSGKPLEELSSIYLNSYLNETKT